MKPDTHRHLAPQCGPGQRTRAPLRLAWAACALVLGMVGLDAGASAQASGEPIEAVWGFNGGEVAIVRQPDGTYSGIVDAATTFASCSHSVGEVMWSAMRRQPDGSYWGLHQWFYESSGCQLNPMLGPTAWRMMNTAGGSRYLQVCFSQPGTSQPTIAPSGASEHVSYRCYESARIAAVPAGSSASSRSGREAFAAAVSLPNPRGCLSRRVFKIHLHSPRFDPIRLAVVSIRGRHVAVDRRGARFSATINLRGFPKGTFTVAVSLTTVLGHHLSGRRAFHTCARKPAHNSKRHAAGARS